jgi:hypothetical protein
VKLTITRVRAFPSGRISRRLEQLDVEFLRIGRGTACELELDDPRVHLLHAELHLRAGRLYLEGRGEAELRLNGADVGVAAVKVGDRVDVGPYTLTFEQPGEGVEAAILLELTRPLEDDYELLVARSTIGFERAGLAMDELAVLAGFGVFVVAWMLPLMWSVYAPIDMRRGPGLDAWWSSGTLDDAHRHFGHECRACHTGTFSGVPDNGCTSCHTQAHPHADVELFPMSGLQWRCAHCHEDHNGPAMYTFDETFCAACHGTPEDWPHQVDLAAVTDFGLDHREFRPAVVTDAHTGARQRVPLAEAKELRSNLSFPHDRHLANRGVLGPDGQEHLVCGSCHQIEESGRMEPVRMEQHCLRCHPLVLESWEESHQLPHGDMEVLRPAILDFYALRAERAEESVQADVWRRRPGEPAEDEQIAATLRDGAVDTAPFGQALCGGCHQIEAAEAGWAVAPVAVVRQWYLAADFDHRPHGALECLSCHPAAGSSTSADVLLPSIATCQGCHGGEDATDLVPSTCTMCHRFHREDLRAALRGEGAP